MLSYAGQTPIGYGSKSNHKIPQVFVLGSIYQGLHFGVTLFLTHHLIVGLCPNPAIASSDSGVEAFN